jgi:outer membrane immunogenic protein
MTLWRSSLLALSVSAGLLGGATLAAADGPGGRGAEWPNIPWTWTGLYGGVHVGSADAGRDDALVGGVQLGRNWQSGKMIYGIEGDVSLSDSDGIDWMGTVRGRLGYLISPSILAYGTAGLGMINFADHHGHGGGDETELVLGVGIEGKLTQSTSVRLEYLNFTDTDIDVIRAGMNWKFNW